MSDPRFFRQYLDILSEAPVTPPTQQQADALDKTVTTATNKMTQGANKFDQGKYASGAMDVASGANDVANAAGMSFGDKVRTVGAGVKAAASAGMAQLRGKDPVAAATGSLGKNLTQPAVKALDDPRFTNTQLKADAAKVGPNAPLADRQMAADVAAGKISADSMKGYANRMNTKMDKMSSGDANDDAFDDSPYIQHSGLKTASTAELDPMKKQAMTGQLKPVEYEPAPVKEDELVRLRELLKR